MDRRILPIVAGVFLFGILIGFIPTLGIQAQNGGAIGLTQNTGGQNQQIEKKVVQLGACASKDYYIGQMHLTLYCFNEVRREGFYKPSHLNQVKELLTKIEVTGEVENPFIGRSDSWAVFQNNMVIVDASAPQLIPGDTKCGGDYGDANYQDPGYGGAPTIYLCYDYFSLPWVEAAGIMYHEANHRWQAAHECPPGDRTPNSVYGAHINFLLAISQNSGFSCGERDDAHQQANLENQKLCVEAEEIDKECSPCTDPCVPS